MRGEQSVCLTFEAGLITLDALLDMGHKHPSISQTFCHQCLKRCDAKKIHMKVMKSSKTKTVSWSERDHDISLLTPGYASWHLCLKVNYTSNCGMAPSICMKDYSLRVTDDRHDIYILHVAFCIGIDHFHSFLRCFDIFQSLIFYFKSFYVIFEHLASNQVGLKKSNDTFQTRHGSQVTN